MIKRPFKNTHLPSVNPNIKTPLVEKFFSVQGEGFNAGRSAMFIRFSGCNLDCVFADGSICDTPWRKPKEKSTVGEVLDWVWDNLPEKHQSTKPHHITPMNRTMVVLTGGEPTMARGFNDLVYGLYAMPVYIAVETNGTIWKDALTFCHHVTVSPKDLPGISHANPLGTPEVHQKVIDMIPGEFRYVITNREEDLPPFIAARNGHYLSPALLADGLGMEAQGTEVPRFVPGAVERCTELVQQDPRWRISLQAHKWMMVR